MVQNGDPSEDNESTGAEGGPGNVDREIVEAVVSVVPTDAHEDGDGRYDYCNAAENHALVYPGHSVACIRDSDTGPNGEDRQIIRVWCNGSPGAFMNNARDCDWAEDLVLYRET